MASNDVGNYHCSICELDFPFKSKLDRHLKSSDHIFFTQCIQRQGLAYGGIEDEEVHMEMAGCSHEGTVGEGGAEGAIDRTDEHSSIDWCDEDFDTTDIEALLKDVHLGNDFSPFPNKIFALLFLLKHSPRPMGESNLKFVWFAMTHSVSADIVPSFSSVKKFQLPGMTHPIRCLTSKGTPYYANTMSSIIQRNMGNPIISQMIRRFPVISGGSHREMYHASRWHEDPRYYAPMVCLFDGTHAFIRDCVTCKHPLLDVVAGIINKFSMQEATCQVLVDIDILLTIEQYRQVVPNTLARYIPHGTLIIYETVTLPSCDIVGLRQPPLSLLIWDLRNETLSQVSQEDCSGYLRPHPAKEKAADRPVVMLPLVLFTDDTSGNVSKKWHKFDSWSLMLAGLPRHENTKIENIHFVCCSDVASAVEMAGTIVTELISLEDGIEVYDALLKQPVLVLAPLMCILADNPRAAELLNHLGSSAKKFCRMCMTDKDVNPTELGATRTLLSSKAQIEDIKKALTEQSKKLLRTKYGIKEADNPMLSLAVDVFRCLPVESLHSILLGPYKYLLKSTIPTLSSGQKEEVLARVRAFNYSGFKVKLMGNVIRHHQSFVGRDYKAWAQMALFIIYPYLSASERKVWVALSKVFKIAYCDYYDPSKEAEWADTCKTFVSVVGDHRPEMLKKPKVHLMLHLVECMKEFGPTSAFNSERCEAFNSFIRVQNVYGNKGAPSRDIACHFATIEHLRYICDGGCSNDKRCGEGLKTLFSTPAVQHFMNSTPMHELHCNKTIYQPGTLRGKVLKATPFSAVKLDLPDAQGGVVTVGNLSLQQPPFVIHWSQLKHDDLVHAFHGVIGQNRELVHTGDFVKLTAVFHEEILYGLLLGCCKTSDGRSLCIVRGLESFLTPSGEPLTNEIDCPLLTLSRNVFATRSSSVSKRVSIIHECSGTCRFVSKAVPRNIERERVSVARIEYEHDFSSNLMYCLNIYCMSTA